MKRMHLGTLVIEGDFDGMLSGTGIVAAGTRATIRGMINGTLVVEAGARVRVTGMVNGPVVDRGGSIDVRGMVGAIVPG